MHHHPQRVAFPGLTGTGRSGVVTCLAAVSGLLMAQDNLIVGPRAIGMGSTGVASAEGTAAQYYNPALLALDRMGPDDGRPWDIGVDASAGLRIHGDLLEIAKDLADAEIGSLGDDGIVEAADLRRALQAVVGLARLGDAGNAVTGEANAALSARIGRFHLGIRMSGQSSALVSETDLLNVAIGAGGAALADAINDSGAGLDGTIGVFTPEQTDNLYAALGGVGAYDPGTSAGEALQRIDFGLRGVPPGSVQAEVIAEILENAGNGSGNIADNATSLRIGGFILAEIPMSMGYAINEHWSVGGSLKLLVGRVYGTEVSIFQDDAALRLTNGIDDFNQTMTWGVDLGVIYQTGWFRAGLSGRNLNSPTFAGFTDSNGIKTRDVAIEPQVKAGVSISPWSWFTAALDADLTAAETTYPGYETQRIGFGLEFRAWRLLALRAGAYQNIAESDIGPVLTLGAGVGLGPVRIEVALASSTELTPILGMNLPDELHASLGLSASF